MDVADRVEATTRMVPTIRDLSAGMVGQEATVVHMDGMVLLKVEDEAERVTRMLRTRFPALTENPTFFPFLWHISVDVQLGGGGCREDFRP